MKQGIVVAAALFAAGAAFAEPPAALEPALKSAIGAAARGVFGDPANPGIRNRAYSIELLRARTQERVAQTRNALSMDAIAGKSQGLRERVFEETSEFLSGLSPEIDRLAKESRDADEFAAQLSAMAGHLASFAGAPAAAAAETAGRRTPTESNIEGPFYRPNAPFKNRLSPADAQGVPLRIAGRVLDTDGKPIAGALVDVWQADPSGAYDISDPQDRNNPKFPYRWRARMKSDAAGDYLYFTIMPGQYEIGEGKWRPKHIHYKVSAPGFRSLTTQLYFEGDEYNAVDPWWKASTTIAIGRGEGADYGEFDIILPSGR